MFLNIKEIVNFSFFLLDISIYLLFICYHLKEINLHDLTLETLFLHSKYNSLM